MGFLKFAYPIKINDKLRILFIAGQKIPKEDKFENILEQNDLKELGIFKENLESTRNEQINKEKNFGYEHIQQSFEEFGKNLNNLINKKIYKKL